MTTYIYETIPADSKEQPKFYEIQQSMKDAPLTKHPKTGEPMRRVVLGGYGAMTKSGDSPDGEPCGPSCGCC